MTTNRTPLEPQTSMSWILRPPENFEALYEGEPRTSPLPFVSPDTNNRYVTRDARAGEPGIDPDLARYVPVPLGATVYILIPRAFYFSGQLLESVYTYELRWRLRTTSDWQRAAAQANPTVPYHLVTREGAPVPAATSPARITLPSFTSEVIVPAAVGAGQRVIVSSGPTLGVATQGLFDPAIVGPGTAFSPNNYFAPLLRRALGDELSIVASRTEDPATWEFAGTDSGLALLYGNDYEGVGIVLISLAASPSGATG